MILNEVHRFRQLVRVQPTTQMQQNMSQAPSVPVPEHYDRMPQEYPRPQEAHGGGIGDLEGDLAIGADGMQYGGR